MSSKWTRELGSQAFCWEGVTMLGQPAEVRRTGAQVTGVRRGGWCCHGGRTILGMAEALVLMARRCCRQVVCFRSLSGHRVGDGICKEVRDDGSWV